MALADFCYGPSGIFFIGITGMISMVFILVKCTWCRSKWNKFKERRNQPSDLSTQTTVVSSVRNTEFSVFPSQLNAQLIAVSTVPTAILDEIVFEPLPEIRRRGIQAVAQNIRPARFTGALAKVSLQDWFAEHQQNFPRNQLKYLREVGSGWYGQAVEGEAYNILANEEKTKIVVKIMRIDATTSEYMHFLHEARPYRDLRHPYLLQLIGRCLEVHPFLLIMEHCDVDLKTCLINHRKSPELLLKNGILLRMACCIASALQYMHEHGYIHSDVAAHSCLVTSDLNVKVGDYGTALHTHKCDYYCLGDIAFPLRWCAPESLRCTDSIVEAKDITREANVWSFGVLLWELLEFGKLPYMDFTDEQVVQKVIIDNSLALEQPKTPCVHKDMIFRIMQFCWLPTSQRPIMQKIITLLNYLYDNKDVLSESVDFESRWNSLQPVLRNHSLVHPSATCQRFENDFLRNEHGVNKDCDSIMSSDFSYSQYGDMSPSRCSLSTGYEVGVLNEISPSLQNLRGSIDDLTNTGFSIQSLAAESKLAEEHEESDSMHKIIIETIKDLDIVLSAEVSSSDASKCTTPERNHYEFVSEVPSQNPLENIAVQVTSPLTNGNTTEFQNTLENYATHKCFSYDHEINNDVNYNEVNNLRTKNKE